MIACLQRLGLIAGTVLSVAVLFSLCGCRRTTGFVMNESGQAYYKHGNYAMAQREFYKAHVEAPRNPHYLYNLAAATQRQGNVAQAEQYYRQALNMNPSHQPSYHGLASLMVEQGRAQEAEQLLANWAGSQPYLAEAHVELAWIQQETGNVGAAEQSLRQALQINPRNEYAIAQLGQVYEAQGRPDVAMAMYQRSLSVDSGQHHVQSRLATLQQQHGPLNPAPQYGAGGGSPTVIAGGYDFTQPYGYQNGATAVASWPNPNDPYGSHAQPQYAQMSQPVMTAASPQQWTPQPQGYPAASEWAPMTADQSWSQGQPIASYPETGNPFNESPYFDQGYQTSYAPPQGQAPMMTAQGMTEGQMSYDMAPPAPTRNFQSAPQQQSYSQPHYHPQDVNPTQMSQTLPTVRAF